MTNTYLGVHLQTPNKVKHIWPEARLKDAEPKIRELMEEKLTNRDRAIRLGVSYPWFLIALRQLSIPTWKNTKRAPSTWRNDVPSSIAKRQAEFRRLKKTSEREPDSEVNRKGGIDGNF